MLSTTTTRDHHSTLLCRLWSPDVVNYDEIYLKPRTTNIILTPAWPIKNIYVKTHDRLKIRLFVTIQLKGRHLMAAHQPKSSVYFIITRCERKDDDGQRWASEPRTTLNVWTPILNRYEVFVYFPSIALSGSIALWELARPRLTIHALKGPAIKKHVGGSI